MQKKSPWDAAVPQIQPHGGRALVSALNCPGKQRQILMYPVLKKAAARGLSPDITCFSWVRDKLETLDLEP